MSNNTKKSTAIHQALEEAREHATNPKMPEAPRRAVSCAIHDRNIVVTCQDGSIWTIYHGGSQWELLPAIPPITEE